MSMLVHLLYKISVPLRKKTMIHFKLYSNLIVLDSTDLCVMSSRVLFGLFLAVVAIASVDCNSERDALNVWKHGLVDPSNALQSWNSTLPSPCTWYRITCNSENSVIRVDLGDNHLSGILVPELGILANLEYLEVYGNNLFGSIPEEIGKLKKLVSLDLYQNNLTGTIPTSLGHLSSLRFMRFYNNRLTGSIPPSLGNLTSLQILELNSNLLTGTVPVEVSSLVQSGTYLNVSDNMLQATADRSNSTSNRANYCCELLLFRINLFVALIYISLF